MKLEAEKIQENWNTLLQYIDTHITGDRKDQLMQFYCSRAERIIMMPASSKSSYHNAIPGGYVDHVNRVIRCAIELYNTWYGMGAYIDNFTFEELIFAAMNHDLGKIGSLTEDFYLPSQDQWRKDKLGEVYTMNSNLDFMTIPDRSLFLLQAEGIQVTLNETIAIRCHDGLYDEANKQYFISYNPEARFKTVMPLIIHQADLMASNIEFQMWKMSSTPVQGLKKNIPLKSNTSNNNAALKKVGENKPEVSAALKGAMSSFFDNI